MEGNKENAKRLKNSFDEDNKYYEKCVNIIKIEFYDADNLIKKNKADDLICPICLNVLKNPISCSSKKNSHSFCKDCIDLYLKESNKCPTCKLPFKYKERKKINNALKKLFFHCPFKSEGCNDIMPYLNYLNHINNCKYNNIAFECHVKKYNYNKKEFEKCGYLGNKINMEKHLKICALIEYKCIFVMII